MQAQQGRDEPAQRRQEHEGLVGAPGAAVAAAEAQAGPVEDVAAAGPAELVDEQAEGDEPADGEGEVGGPVDEAGGEGEQPEQGEEEGEAGDDLGVDEAAELPGGLVGVVEVVAGDACDDGPEDELERGRKGELAGSLERGGCRRWWTYLGQAEYHVEYVCQDGHLDGFMQREIHNG